MNNFTITLNDNTKLEGLRLNGNNFITNNESHAAKLNGKLGRVTNILKDVTISGDAEYDQGGLIGDHEFMEIVQCVKYENEWWFVLRDLSAEEIRGMRIDARLDYIEMMMEEN